MERGTLGATHFLKDTTTTTTQPHDADILCVISSGFVVVW